MEKAKKLGLWVSLTLLLLRTAVLQTRVREAEARARSEETCSLTSFHTNLEMFPVKCGETALDAIFEVASTKVTQTYEKRWVLLKESRTDCSHHHVWVPILTRASCLHSDPLVFSRAPHSPFFTVIISELPHAQASNTLRLTVSEMTQPQERSDRSAAASMGAPSLSSRLCRFLVGS